MRRGFAMAIAVLSLALTAAGVVLMATSWGVPLVESWGFRGFTAIFALTGTSVGLLIARNRPDHRVGWLLLLSGALSAIQFFGDEYAILSFFTRRDPLPAASWLGWLNVWTWVPSVVAIAVLTPLYFPDGRLPSPAWRPAVWLAAAATGSAALSAMADPLQTATNMRGAPPPYDPLALGPVAGYAGLLFGFVGFPLITVAAVVAAVSVVRRYRRAQGAERQQIKWFAFGALWMSIAASINVVAQIVFGLGGAVQFAYTSSPVWKAAEYLLIAAFAFVIVSVGLAVLRYRLYDVDLVINRTLVYGSLSAVLAATYAVSVVLFQAFVSPHVGGSEIGIAASTLITLALVQPLRRRIQGLIDRRFYRSRYDTVRTLDDLARRLRDEVDLDAVRSDVLDVVGTTVRPAHAGVWLRGSRS